MTVRRGDGALVATAVGVFSSNLLLSNATRLRLILFVAVWLMVVALVPAMTYQVVSAEETPPVVVQLTGWRRTSLGWERVTDWNSLTPEPLPSPVTAIHPAVVASLVLLLSVGALVAGSSTSSRIRD